MLQPLTMKMENADGVVEVQDAVEFLVREAGGVPLSTATLFAPERTAGWSAQLRLPGDMLLVSFPDGLCFYDGTMPTTSAWRRAVAATGDVAIITGPMTDPTCVDGAIWGWPDLLCAGAVDHPRVVGRRSTLTLPVLQVVAAAWVRSAFTRDRRCPRRRAGRGRRQHHAERRG
jgi:hypothetical protein